VDQIQKKVGLRPSDVKQLAHVLLGILNSLFRNHELHLEVNPKTIESVINAALSILSTTSMKVRNNIAYLTQDRFSIIEIKAY
jgi:hypothetical protein